MTDDTDAIQEMFAAVSLGSPENAVGFVLWRVMHRYQREIDRVLASEDLTHLQFTTLAMVAWLVRTGEAATQSALAKTSDIHPMQVSHMLKALEAKGMIIRTRDPLDVRAKRIGLTSSGLTALEEAMPLVIAVQCRLFGVAGQAGGPLLTALSQIEDDNRK